MENIACKYCDRGMRGHYRQHDLIVHPRMGKFVIVDYDYKRAVFSDPYLIALSVSPQEEISQKHHTTLWSRDGRTINFGQHSMIAEEFSLLSRPDPV